MIYVLNIKKRLIFAGIFFGLFVALVLYGGLESLMNVFPQIWIIPDWFLLGFIITLCLTFADVIMFAIIIGLILIFAVWFVFVGVYLIPISFLYQTLIPQTNSILLKLIIYSIYAAILFILVGPLLLSWYYDRNKGYGGGISAHTAWSLVFIGSMFAVSVVFHYSAYFISYFTWIYGHLVWFIPVFTWIYGHLVWFVPVFIGVIWLAYFLITGDILIYEQIDDLNLNRERKRKNAYYEGWREAENSRRGKEEEAYWRGRADESQKANTNTHRETNRARDKKLTNDKQGIELNREELGRLVNLWQQKYTQAEGNKEKMKEANDKLLFYTDLFKKLKNKKEVIK